MIKEERVFFGVELTVLSELEVMAHQNQNRDTYLKMNDSLMDYFWLSLSQAQFYERDLFEKMHDLTYEQIQTIKTLVEIGMDNPTRIYDIEDLFDDKLMSLKWTGDSGKEILSLIRCGYFPQGLSKGIEIIGKMVDFA